MTPERWQQIERVFHAALARDAQGRALRRHRSGAVRGGLDGKPGLGAWSAGGVLGPRARLGGPPRTGVTTVAAPVKSYGLAVRLGPGGRQLAVSVQSLSRMMVAGFEPGPSPHIGAAQSLFEVGARGLHFGGMPVRCFDVAPDGQRFYVVQTLTPPPTPVVTHRSTSC